MKMILEVDTGDDFNLESKMYSAWVVAQIYKVDLLMKRTGLRVGCVRDSPRYGIYRNGSVMDYTYYDLEATEEEALEMAEKHEDWIKELCKKVDEEVL